MEALLKLCMRSRVLVMISTTLRWREKLFQVQREGLQRCLQEAQDQYRYVPYYANSIEFRLYFQECFSFW